MPRKVDNQTMTTPDEIPVRQIHTTFGHVLGVTRNRSGDLLLMVDLNVAKLGVYPYGQYGSLLTRLRRAVPLVLSVGGQEVHLTGADVTNLRTAIFQVTA